ncbi:MAG: proline--tRNA ligase [Patescibacteria group bacterium]|nr:proline--tRNA ligase [Patescibacteria group bacterium]
MYQSRLFGKTNKTSQEYESTNATYLIKAGFVDQVMAGGYTFLTLGNRVLQKIENIVREEMDTISTEVLMPSIVPTALWEQSGRLETIDVLMKTIPANKKAAEKNDSEYVLNCTHEDVVTPLAKKLYPSYRDLPMTVYQIQTKFRNEPRAKSGLLRCREFRMKDMYSFHTTNEDLLRFYEVVKEAYWRVYERLGLKDYTYVALASGGDFTKNFSHEFQVKVRAGEDVLFHVPSKNLTFNREVAPSMAPPIDDSAEELKPLEHVESPGMIGVQQIADFLGIPTTKTIKTMLFEDQDGKVIAAAVRGDYDVDENKLKKAAGVESLTLASEATIKRVTGAEIGYAGILNLPAEVRVLVDDALKGRRNMEMGANRTNYHSVNVNFGRDLPEPEQYYDIKVAKEGDLYPETGELYEVFRAAEVGNIFPLETKFSKAFDYKFIDNEGKQQLVYMGSYGIGTSRIMGVLVELFHDDKGIIWPEAVAPYRVHLIGIALDDSAVRARAEEVYKMLTAKGVEVLFDDRDVRPGEKFADADLIGIPHRIVVSRKTADRVEYKRRDKTETRMMDLEELCVLLALK